MRNTLKNIPDALKAYFSQQQGVLCAYLFGSVAAGRAHRSSDVDVAVLFDSTVAKTDYTPRQMTFMDEISHLLDKEVDVVVLNAASAFLRFQILREGARFYERPGRSDHHFEAYTILEYLDFLPIRERLEAAVAHRIRGA